MSTSGDVQYIGGCSVHWRDTMSTSKGYHEYIGGCSVHRGMFSTSGDVKYIGDIMIHVGGTMSTSGDVQYIPPMY